LGISEFFKKGFEREIQYRRLMGENKCMQTLKFFS